MVHGDLSQCDYVLEEYEATYSRLIEKYWLLSMLYFLEMIETGRTKKRHCLVRKF